MFEENWTACADFPNIVAQRKSYAHAASDEMFCMALFAFCIINAL